MGFTEKQLSELGYIETSPGKWSHPSEVRDRDTDEVPGSQPDPEARAEGQDAVEVPVQESVFGSARVRIVVTSYRARLADSDGPVGKWFIDCLVTHGIITDDRLEFVEEVVVRQVKCRKSEERTVLAVELAGSPTAPRDTAGSP